MAKSKTVTTNRASHLWTLAAIAIGVLALLIAYVNFVPSDGATTSRANPTAKWGDANDEPGSVKVLKPRYEDDKLVFDKSHQVPPAGQNSMVFAVNAFLKASGVSPEGALAERVELMSGVANISFNAAFRETYGTEDEHTIVDGIRTTMGQFPEVEFVRFSIGSEPLETLGNIDLTTPLKVLRP